MKVLIDHNISPHIAHALAAMARPEGHMVRARSEMFDVTRSVPDTEWLGALGREGSWASISDDHRIYRNPHERAVMLQSGSSWSRRGASGAFRSTNAPRG